MVDDLSLLVGQKGVAGVVDLQVRELADEGGHVNVHTDDAHELAAAIDRGHIGDHLGLQVLVEIGIEPGGIPQSLGDRVPAHMGDVLRIIGFDIRQGRLDEGVRVIAGVPVARILRGYLRGNAVIVGQHLVGAAGDAVEKTPDHFQVFGQVHIRVRELLLGEMGDGLNRLLNAAEVEVHGFLHSLTDELHILLGMAVLRPVDGEETDRSDRDDADDNGRHRQNGDF